MALQSKIKSVHHVSKLESRRRVRVTPEQILEFKKCAADPIYFLINYAKIKHPTQGTIPFALYTKQIEVLLAFKNNRLVAINKARQIGMSTLVAGYAAWRFWFNWDQDILIVSTKKKTAAGIIKKVKTIIKNMPKWMKQLNSLSIDNVFSVEAMNGNGISRIEATPKSEDVGRSEGLSLLIIDEAAHIKGFDNVWTGIKPTISTGGQCFILSCVTKDTYVYTDKGIKQVEDFIKKDCGNDYKIPEYKVVGVNGSRCGNLFHNNGLVKTKKIITQHAELEGSYNHKVWSYRSDIKQFGWSKLEDLKVNDYVSIQYGMDVWGNNDDVSSYRSLKKSTKMKNNISIKGNMLNKHMCYFLGLYVSEGSSYLVKNDNGEMIGGNITISCGDNIDWIFDKIGVRHYDRKDEVHYSVSSKDLICFMQYLGFDLSRKANNKIIPKRLLEMSKENIVWLLRGIFDGDGGSRKDRGTVSFTSTSKELINQIRVMLINFGILTNYYFSSKEKLNEYNNKKGIKYNHDRHSLEMNQKYSKLYYDNIGFNIKRKLDNLNILKHNGRQTFDFVPNSIGLLKQIVDESKIRDKFLRKIKVNKSTYLRGFNKDICRNKIVEILELTRNNLSQNTIDFMDKVISKNIKWVKIKEIKDGTNETFDFSLPENESDFWCHSILYNGIIGHQTPKGVSNQFHTICKDAMNSPGDGLPGINGFVYYELPWYVAPYYDKLWYETETRGLNERAKRQEYNCQFLGSGDTVLESETLETLAKEVEVAKVIRRDDKYNLINIYREYDSNKMYLMTGDTSRGDAEDFTGFHVWEIVSSEEIHEAAVYKDKVPYDVSADVAVTLYNLYHAPLTAIETNFLGVVIMGEMFKRDCDNIYYSVIKDKVKDTNYKDSKEEQLKKVPGFTTSGKTRDMAVSVWERMFREGKFHISSKLTYNEMSTFIWKRTPMSVRAEAQAGSHDDLVMSSVIAAYIIGFEYDKLLAGVDDIAKLYEGMHMEKRGITTVSNRFNDSILDQKGGTSEEREKNERLLKMENKFSDFAQAFNSENENPDAVMKLKSQYKAQKELMEIYPELFSG